MKMKQQGKWALALLVAAGFQTAQGDPAASSNTLARSSWYDDMQIKGDMRYRFDNIQLEGQPNRERERLRARVGLYPQINADVDAGLRLGTAMTVSGAPGEGNPKSENQTLTDQNTQKALYLDLGYLDWHPHAVPGLDVIGGKMANPFIVVDTYLWDPDLAPEGLAAKYHVGDKVQFLANATYQWLKERATSDDSRLYAGQLALNYKPDADSHVMVGASYYGFQKMQGFQVLDWQNNNNAWGNTITKQVSGTTTNSLYANEFKVLEGFAEAGTKVLVPVTVFGAYARNSDPGNNNQAWTLGLLLGKAKDPGTFQVGYDYRHLEKDAWPGALPDDDAWGGGTDGAGHKFTLVYQLMKNLQLCGTCWLTRENIAPGETSRDYKEFMVDVLARF
ncbi:MAG: putative porin [Kiritimatiellaeota bacterium]|nr:putative porin [Kiritimatiellota bacterium]